MFETNCGEVFCFTFLAEPAKGFTKNWITRIFLCSDFEWFVGFVIGVGEGQGATKATKPALIH